MAGPRLTISPNQVILDLVDNYKWPLRVPKHRLMRLALQLGLEGLAKAKPDEFLRIVTEDAVTSVGILPHQ